MFQAVIDEDERGKIVLEGTAGIDKISYSVDLEKHTGADFMLSPLAIPPVPNLLKKHGEAGALFVQVKRGMDYPSSITSARIKESLIRMYSVTGSAFQRVLMPVGDFRVDRGMGTAMLDGRPIELYGHAPNTYMAGMTLFDSKTKWETGWGMNGRGGRYAAVPTDADISTWVESQIRVMSNAAGDAIFPDKINKSELIADDDLIPLVLVPDAWAVFAAIRGIGPKTIQAYNEVFGEHYCLWLEDMTNLSGESPVKGVGKGTIAAVRKLFNLEPWEFLGRVVNDELAVEYAARQAKNG